MLLTRVWTLHCRGAVIEPERLLPVEQGQQARQDALVTCSFDVVGYHLRKEWRLAAVEVIDSVALS